jgi:hypothetical protein
VRHLTTCEWQRVRRRRAQFELDTRVPRIHNTTGVYRLDWSRYEPLEVERIIASSERSAKRPSRATTEPALFSPNNIPASRCDHRRQHLSLYGATVTRAHMVVCVLCNAADAVVFCYNDNANLCSACDAQIHKTNKLAWKHQRVFLCETCENHPKPASVYCTHDKVRQLLGVRVQGAHVRSHRRRQRTHSCASSSDTHARFAGRECQGRNVCCCFLVFRTPKTIPSHAPSPGFSHPPTRERASGTASLSIYPLSLSLANPATYESLTRYTKPDTTRHPSSHHRSIHRFHYQKTNNRLTCAATATCPSTRRTASRPATSGARWGRSRRRTRTRAGRTRTGEVREPCTRRSSPRTRRAARAPDTAETEAVAG